MVDKMSIVMDIGMAIRMVMVMSIVMIMVNGRVVDYLMIIVMDVVSNHWGWLGQLWVMVVDMGNSG